VAQGLVLGWLQDIAGNGKKFRELQAHGRERLGRQLGELRDTLKGLESEEAALKDRVELRIQELTRTKAEAVRDSIEKAAGNIWLGLGMRAVIFHLICTQFVHTLGHGIPMGSSESRFQLDEAWGRLR